MADHVFRHVGLQWMRSIRIIRQRLARRGTECAGQFRGRILRMIKIAWWQGLADVHADRHQYRLDPVVAESVSNVAGIQDHVLWSQPDLDDLAIPLPPYRQHAVQDEERFLDLMR